MTRLCRGFVLVVLSVCVIQAEWFDKGKVRYKTLDGKWRKAAVHVTDDGIEVYDRKHRSLVATFASLDPKINEDLSVPMRRGAVAYGLLSGAVIAGYLAVSEEPGYVTDCFYADYSSSCTSYWSEGRDAVITAGAAWKAIGVMSAVAAVIAAIPARPTEYTFTDGPRSITVRVGRKNQQRFINALSIRGSIEWSQRQPGSSAVDVTQTVLFGGDEFERPGGRADLQESGMLHHSDELPHAEDGEFSSPHRELVAEPSTASLPSLFSRRVYSRQPGS